MLSRFAYRVVPVTLSAALLLACGGGAQDTKTDTKASPSPAIKASPSPSPVRAASPSPSPVRSPSPAASPAR